MPYKGGGGIGGPRTKKGAPKLPKSKPRPVARSIPQQRTGPAPKPRVKPITKPSPPSRSVGRAIEAEARKAKKPKKTGKVGKAIQQTAKREKRRIRREKREERQRARDRKIAGALSRLGTLNDPSKKLVPVPEKPTTDFVKKLQRQRTSTKKYSAHKRKPYKGDKISKRDPRLAPTKVAGVSIDAAVADLDRRLFPKANPGLQLAKVPVEIVKATGSDPGGVAKGTAKALKDTVVSLPSVAVSTVKDPEGTLKALGEDYKRRYGPLLKGDEETFRKRLEEEGVLSEVADIGGVTAAGGRIAGVGRALAKKPKPRPKLRTSGGKAKEQRVSGNLFVEGAQRTQDITRKKVQQRRSNKAAKREAPVDALVATAVRAGDEVAPVRLRRAKRKQHREVARGKGRNLQTMKHEQAEEVHRGAAREVAKLSRKERLGLKYAVQLGVRDPKTARKVLAKRLETIKAERATSGTKVPRVLRKTNDEVRAIEAILKAPEATFTPRLAKVADAQRGRSGRLSAGDPTLDLEQTVARRYAPVAEHLGVKRQEGESTREFAMRVRKEADKGDLATPGYFPSQKRPTARYSDYAIGGTKAAAGDKSYTGALFRTGREDISPQPMLDALARNIKRKHNWKHVQDTFNEHAFSWGRNKSLAELRDELDAKGIDPSSVGFWNPGKFKEQRALKEEIDAQNPELGLTDEAFGEEPSVAGLDRAVDEAAIPGQDAMALVGSRGGEKGWSVIPRGVYDEIHADTRSSGALGRSLDIAKGKQSRYLLGAGNLPWLQFQVASNALLTGMAKTGPVDFVKAQVWWKKLDPELKREVQPWVGIGHFQGDVQQTKLGAAANNRFVNGYRAFKQTPLARKASKGNPLDLLFRADNAQNNAFRRAVLYSQVKRDAYQRMGRNVSKTMAAQQRLTGVFKLGPRKQMDAILKNRNLIERHSQYVNDWLGDYVTYTAKERRWLARNVMFYGFLRFSLNFAFNMMPRKHPIMTALIANLGQLQADEVRTLLGGDELPFAFGKLYFTEGDELKEVPLGRMNPAANAALEVLSPGEDETSFLPRRLLNMLPPAFTTALDLAYGKSAFSGKDLRVKGETGYEAALREDPLALEEMGRVAAARGLKLFYPYRLAEELAFDGEPQGDDTLLWDPRPTEYAKDSEAGVSIRKGVRRTRARGTGRRLLEETVPLIPRPTRDRELARSIRERRKETEGESGGSGGGSSGGPVWDRDTSPKGGGQGPIWEPNSGASPKVRQGGDKPIWAD